MVFWHSMVSSRMSILFVEKVGFSNTLWETFVPLFIFLNIENSQYMEENQEHGNQHLSQNVEM